MSYREELIVRVTEDGTAEVIHSGLTEPKVLRPGDSYQVVWSAGLTYKRTTRSAHEGHDPESDFSNEL